MSDLANLAYANTLIDLVLARPLRRLSSGIIVPANTRAVMAAGLAGEVRVRAGRTVEDELIRHRPLDLGSAYSTGAGKLAEAGVEVLAHAVVIREPGEPSRPGQDERAVLAALRIFEDAGTRTITLPIIQLADGRPRAEREQRTLAGPLLGHLRRKSRIRRITIAGLDAEYLEQLRAELIGAGAIPAGDQAAPR